MMRFRVDGSIVLWRNPRTGEWAPVTNFGSSDAARAALRFYEAKTEWAGWVSVKLSKSQ